MDFGLEKPTLSEPVQGIGVTAQLGRQGGGGYPWFGFGFGGDFLLDHRSEKFVSFLGVF